MKKILKDLPEEEKKKIEKKKMPDFIKPMLAKLTHDHFYKDGWIYERKLDGERILLFKKGEKISLKTRNKKSANTSYPEIVKAAKKIKADQIILDGEVVAFKGDVTSFSRLQDRMHVKSREEAESSNVGVYYYIFDIVYLDGYDINKLPLQTRKDILKKVVSFNNRLRFTAHRVNDTKKYYKNACKKGWEGLIVKKADGPYLHKRSSDWLKFKCVHEQEFVIAGYTEPGGSRKGFGALLLGYYKGDKLKYAGRVGTGFDDETLKSLAKKLKKIKTKKNPFDSDEPEGKGVHFVKPRMVGEAGFTEWTDDNKLRHPRFLGLRRDKSPKKVRREDKK